MKKVININFQGRVIPIEENAYDALKQYVESLRRFFANEEGKDEIINDIESRIAELFSERLKKGSTCITETDVESIIAGMGRPEDFEEEEGQSKTYSNGEKNYQNKQQASNSSRETVAGRGQLFRDMNDKILGGVCSGLAAYFRIDPTIVRLILVLLVFSWGTGFILYILLWVILPSRPLDNSIPSTKRLYRNPDEKVLGGVASGIATYFDIAIWIPRLVFATPLIFGLISSLFRSIFSFHWGSFPGFAEYPGIVFSSFSGTLFIVYLVLWAVIPEALTASEKLEMRGEKVDLNTIKNTIQEDLEGFKNRAEKWSGEFAEKAKEFGGEFSNTVGMKTKHAAMESRNAVKKGAKKIIQVLGILIKAFFLFIGGIIGFALIVAFMAVIVSGISVFPLKNYLLEGEWQNILAWSSIALFICIPLIGIIVWVIKLIMGIKTRKHSLRWIFGGLWTLGWISMILLIASVAQNFKERRRERNDIPTAQPLNNKLLVRLSDTKWHASGTWMKMGNIQLEKDSIVINNINLRFLQSKDDMYHISYTKYSNGTNEEAALSNISKMHYNILQQDSIVLIDKGFSLLKGTCFRNQGIVIDIQVPVGKKIEIDRYVRKRLDWLEVHVNDFTENDDWENDWNITNFKHLMGDREYIMTVDGLEQVKNNEDEPASNSSAIEKYKKSKEALRKEYEKKQKEADELKKELDKPFDSIKNRRSKSTVSRGLSLNYTEKEIWDNLFKETDISSPHIES